MKSKIKLLFSTCLFIFSIILGCKKDNLSTKNTDSTGSSGQGSSVSATVTMPNTQFIASQDYSSTILGAYWTQKFTITTNTNFVFRFASEYQAQAAIITADQLSNFQKNLSFTGYGLFDKTIGTHLLTLNTGTYYLAIRNANNGTNKWSTELDYSIALPTSDKATFYDNYISASKSFNKASKFSQPGVATFIRTRS